VGSVEHVELLRRRCRAFYSYALMVFERGDYDTAMFMCEQAVQFCLKAVLLRILGFVPRAVS
jgi:HEPN domain-containing protein